MENASIFLSTNSNMPIPALGGVIFLNIIVLGVFLPLNVYVLWLYVISVRNGVASEFFSLNICVSEIFICFSTLLSVFNITVYQNDVSSPLYFFMLFFSVLHNIIRPFFQCCVCVERFMAVIYPVIFLKYKPLRYRTALSLVTWTIVVGCSVACSFLSMTHIMYYILLPEYLLLLSVKMICSISVLKALRKPGPGEKLSKEDAESNRMKKKAFWVIVIIMTCMFFTNCPRIILMFVYDSLTNTQKSICILAFSYFMIFGEFVDPFLYLQRVGKLTFISGL